MITGPVFLPDPPPDPAPSEVKKLMTYMNSGVKHLERVQEILYEISDAPDEALYLIQEEGESMIKRAKTIRSNLKKIKAEAEERMERYKQDRPAFKKIDKEE